MTNHPHRVRKGPTEYALQKSVETVRLLLDQRATLKAERDEAVALLRSFLVNPPEGKTFKQHVRGSAERFLARLDGGAK